MVSVVPFEPTNIIILKQAEGLRNNLDNGIVDIGKLRTFLSQFDQIKE